MRKTCLICTRKHLTQAMILVMESVKDPIQYGWHRYLACGHMAEAEDECMDVYPEMALHIREYRIQVEEGEYENLFYFFEEIIKDLTAKIDSDSATNQPKLD